MGADMKLMARNAQQVGTALRRARNAKNITQTELSVQSGVRQATISTIEAGHPGTRLETICQILAALELELIIAPRASEARPNIAEIF